jgi:hypothetical protein
MSPIAAVASTLLGAALILAVVRDAFEALFHPEGRMALSRGAMRAIWALFRPLSRRHRERLVLAGPLTLLAILAGWAVMLACGWALVLWPHFPDGFRFATELGPPEDQSSFVDALYLSLVTLGTIGFGDIAPADAGLRLLLPVEALIGFGLLTAGVSWLLSVYPALSRRRSLAYEITLLRDTLSGEPQRAVLDGQARAAERLFAELLSRLVAAERDLVAIPLTYYFTERDERFSLPAALPWLLDLTDRALASDVPEPTRLRASLLRAAIDDFAHTTAERFHGGGARTTRDMLAGYADDHLCEPANARTASQSSSATSAQSLAAR